MLVDAIMTNMPDPQTLATLVSNVTETMCGISFEPAKEVRHIDPAGWRLAILPINGKRRIQVLLSSDRASSLGLGAALLGFPADQLDSSMIDDSLCELLNMAAGQIKRALSVDDALGLPRIVEGEAGEALFKTARHQGTMLRSRGSLDLIIWVTESTDQGS
jgi:CheY-specific phosphatase CheX